MHKVFISYHHDNDQGYKKELLEINDRHSIFMDGSVDTDDIDENLDDATIRELIRDNYLKDSTVTILLVGTETKKRKHIDWEIYSSMYNGKINKKSGILVINLPSTGCNSCTASHQDEKEEIHPEIAGWTTITSRAEYESKYPHLPARIIDNLLEENVNISVVAWDKIVDSPDKLTFLIDATFEDRADCNYNLTRDMRRANS